MGEGGEEDDLWNEPLLKWAFVGLEGNASQGWEVVMGRSPCTLHCACLVVRLPDVLLQVPVQSWPLLSGPGKMALVLHTLRKVWMVTT